MGATFCGIISGMEELFFRMACCFSGGLLGVILLIPSRSGRLPDGDVYTVVSTPYKNDDSGGMLEFWYANNVLKKIVTKKIYVVQGDDVCVLTSPIISIEDH
jgi:hypothetical protein